MPARILGFGKRSGRLFWQTIQEFLADGCPQMAAAISFYMLFSLPPLLVLITMLVEPFLDAATVVAIMEQEAGNMIGPQAAAQVELLLENVTRPGQGGALAAVLGIGAFLFGATAAFGQLQAALNTAWRVGPDPSRGDVMNFLIKRALSFAMISVIGVMLILTLIMSTVLGAFGDTLELISPRIPSADLLRIADAAVSFTIATLLFAGMFRYLPDARVGWRAAAQGGAVTAVLFTAGKVGVGYWLGSTDAGSAFGAAGSLALVLIWIYYSSMILLFGAELTQVWMKKRGEPIEPKEGAVRIIRQQEQFVRKGKPESKVPSRPLRERFRRA
jgi:membrane protein